jgi:hypothetical protein
MSSQGIATRSYIEPEAEPLGHSTLLREVDAQTGSEQLSNAIHRMIANFAIHHRIPVDDAQKLILDIGVRI